MNADDSTKSREPGHPENCLTGKLTVLFEDPFWIGVFERESPEGYAVARVVFGSEPADPELYNFILERYSSVSYSRPLPGGPPPAKKVSFKRRQRQADQALASSGTSTKAQEALRLELEQNKQERRVVSQAEQQADEARKFRLRQEKRKAKHRGR
jgi:hypothetical protein